MGGNDQNPKASTEIERVYHHARNQVETAANILDQLSHSTEKLCGSHTADRVRAERETLEPACPDGALFSIIKELNQIQALLYQIGRKADVLSEVI
jgi:hypothetical protein